MASRLQQIITPETATISTPGTGSRLNLLLGKEVLPTIPEKETFLAKTFPSTAEILEELKIAPLSLRANPKEAISSAWNTIKETIKQSAPKILNLITKSFFPAVGITGITTKEPSKAIGEQLEATAAVGHLAFTPISALFEGANEIPVLGSVSRLISLPFVAVGEGGSAISGKIVDELPIPDKDKENIKQGVQEITALAAQLALGKITHIGGKKIKELKTKFGEKDGQTIADKAQEFAEQAKEPVPEAPKIAPVAQKGLPEAITAEKGIIGYHGTNKEFIDFKSDIPGSTYYGQGSYFTNVKDRALTYGKNIKEASIEFKNPYISGTKYNQKMIDELNKLFKSKKDKVFLNRIIEEKRPINSTEVGRHIIPELYKKAGYDGLIIRDGYEMVVFDKSAIKEISKGIIPKELEPLNQWSELQKTNPELFNTGILRKSQAPYKAVGEIPEDVHTLQGKWQNYGQDAEIPANKVYNKTDNYGYYLDKEGGSIKDTRTGEFLVSNKSWDDHLGEIENTFISNKQLKDEFIRSFSTLGGKKYLKEVIDTLPKNPDGSITAYRIGNIGGEGAQSYTLSEGMAKTFSNQGTDILPAGIPGLPKGGYKDFGVLPVNTVKIDTKGIKAWSPYDAEILVESKYVKPYTQATKGIKEVDDLATSISKAKASGQSFDEWVKGQGKPVYFGKEREFIPSEIKGSGLSVSLDENIAQRFADIRKGKITEIFISPQARIATIKDIPDNFRRGTIADPLYSASIWAKKQGYDALDFSDIPALYKEKEIRVFKPDILKTRSQLKAVWDAIKGMGEVKAEIKPISKELEPFEVKPKRKYIEIPREQLPIRIEQAEKGVSALEARMKGIFETENVKRAKAEAEARGLDISIYDKMSKPEQINAAAKYVARISQKEVLEVLEGKREAPKGLLHNSIMIALEEKSLRDKNVDLAIKLASLRSTRAGQEISILTEVGELSPVSGMDAIIRARRESATKKLGEGQTLQTKKTSQIKEIKTEQTKFQMKLSEAEKLLNSIVC